MGRTVAEKILARTSGSETVSPGDHVVCDVDVAMAHDLGTLQAMHLLNDRDVDIWDPDRIVLPMDHRAPSNTVDDANAKTRIRKFVEQQGIEHFYEVGTGISHEVLPEKGHVRPGELVVGRDSHTTSLGAFGAAATGVGGTDIAYVLATGQNWFRVPESIRIELDGEFPPSVSAKDVMLHLAGKYGTDMARYKSIEYGGSAVDAMNLDDRFTLANMSIELGAKFGFTPVDGKVMDYVDDRTDKPYQPQHADEDATYLATYEVDVTGMRPKVAKPHRVSNVVDIDEVVGTELDQVFIGSCTNGKFEDLKDAAAILDGATVEPGTRLIVTPASREIYMRAEREGLVETFSEAGGIVTHSTCGACLGLSTGVLGEGEVCLAAQNRNFKGRMGSDESEIYLSSPEVAAASAITGHITDPAEV